MQNLEIQSCLDKIVVATENAPSGEILAQRRASWEGEPENPAHKHAYAEALMVWGRVREGAALLKEVIDAHPERVDLRLGWLWNLHYLPGYDRVFFREQYQTWAPQLFAAEAPLLPRSSRLKANKRLTVGFLSGNFLSNSVMTPFEAAWDAFDHEAFDFVAYSNVDRPDRATEHWRQRCRFRDIQSLPDIEVARQVLADGVDILLAVGGYCRGSRIGVLAYRPAPIQVDFGALSTLGLPQVDVRLTDPILDPPDRPGRGSERLMALSPLIPFIPPMPCPDVTALPADTKGYITFGSFNNHRKINALILALWAQVLQGVPDARLVIKCPKGSDLDLQAYYRGQFQALGVDPARIAIHGESTYSEHMRLLGSCDLLLDTFPYNGARGTMEGLWMGLPTVSLVGDTFVSREGLAIQAAVGLDVFTAQSEQEYVDKAVSFAGQRENLATIRSSLRVTLLNSPLCDARGWAERFQDALRDMWRRGCSEDRKI